MSNNIKSYPSKTRNRGTTIILEDGLTQAIYLTRQWIQKQKDKPNNCQLYKSWDKDAWLQSLKECEDEIFGGNAAFAKAVQDKVDDYLGIIDDIYPIFSLNKQGYKRTSDEGIHASPELLAAGEEQCIFASKHSQEKHLLKTPSGEGAYRILINTDVSWWGQADDNCALVACIIILLQRYAPVEVWIQQGWLGSNKQDGVTLFKLDFTAGLDLSLLAFWIASPLKDNPFSYIVNRALGRVYSGTSTVAEIENDLMLRGDWFLMASIEEKAVTKLMATERMDLIGEWIAKTSYKIIYGPEAEGTKNWDEIFGVPEEDRGNNNNPER